MTGRHDDPSSVRAPLAGPVVPDGPAATSAPVTPAELVAMDRALDLAARGPEHGPNPRVGCVLLGPDGTVLAEGWHEGAGTPHAEAAAVTAAQAAGVDLRGSTAVVTLEPCAHTGRTGPCAGLLLAAGVSRVVVAVDDPNPVAAGGAATLRAAGVDVVVGALRDEGEALLRVWLHAVRTGRPFVTLKLATTLDGRVAAADGTSRWITSVESRQHAHGLRSRVDAIAVGTGTVLTDDPALTARTTAGDLADHQPLRVVVGRRPLLGAARLRGPGGEVVRVETHEPAEVLDHLAGREVRHLLVEGGPTLSSAFLRAGLVDEVHVYLAPLLLGAGLPAVADLGVSTIADALHLVPLRYDALGPDLLVVAAPARDRPGVPDRPGAPGPTRPARTSHRHEEKR